MGSSPRMKGSAPALAVLWLAVAGASLAVQPAPPPPIARQLADGVWWIPGSALANRQPDGNTVVLEGPDGLVVLDTGRHRWHREAILALAQSRKAPIAAIVNSHWHLDHVSGNPDLKAAYPAAKVYASDAIDTALSGFLRSSAASAREYLASPGIPEETAEDIRGDLATTERGARLRPDIVIAASGAVVLGGRRVEVNLARHGPTAGDVWLYDPATRVAAVGDLVTLPVPFLDTACVDGWKAAMARVWETPFETLVPGHGNPMRRAEFARYRDAFEQFATCARSEREASECAAGWARDAGSLIEASSMDAKRAERMAVYYVREVLRPNGGNSRYCTSAG